MKNIDTQARLKQACFDFELQYGKADAVANGDFVHFQIPEQPAFRWWPFNWRQFPRWMPGYTAADHAAILQEIRDVLATGEDVCIPTCADWREMVMETWQAVGGRPEDLLTLLDEIDAQSV